MEQKRDDSTTKWVNNAADLLESYRSLLTLHMVDHTSMGASISIIGILSMFMVIFVLLFAGLGFAWWLGEYFSNMKAGFFIIGGIYLVIFLAVLLTSKKILLPLIRDRIIKKIYEQD